MIERKTMNRYAVCVAVGLSAICATSARTVPAPDGGCPVSVNLRGHENTEWSRSYAYHLVDGRKDLPRVLLVGDSIVNGYEGEARRLLEAKGVNVTYWISSYCVTSPHYLTFLGIYLDEAKYDVIHFNNGLHSLDTPTADWEKRFEAALRLIREKQPAAKIVWCTSTPLKDAAKTAKVRELNAAGAKVVARLGGIETHDLFAALDPLDRNANWSDMYHHKPHVRKKEGGLVAQAVLSARRATPAKDAYIFSYFCGQSDGLHLAVSDDGLNWTALNGNKSVLKPMVGKDRLMRDPSICRSPDGVYRMVWTTSWHDRIIGYAETRDFVNWSEQRAIPVMEHEKGCQNCWAPELTYDPDTGTYHIYWASTIAGRGDGHRIYRTTTRDFKTFTPTEKWFDPGFSVIDAAIVRDPLTQDWVMTIKDEREKPVAKKHILTTRARSLDKGFPTKLDGPINFGPDWVEGPSPFLVGKEIFVCFDNYRCGRYNMISSSDGGKTWKDRTAELHLPEGIRHGTVIAVPKQEKDALAERFRN